MCTGVHPYIPVPNTALVQIFYTQYGQRMETTLHYFKGGGYTPADLTALADAVISHWGTDVRGVVSTTVELIGVKVTDLTTATSPTTETAPAAPLFGTLTSTPFPSGTTFAIKTATGARGRSAQGRLYHVGMVDSQVTGNEVEPTSADAIKDAWAAMIFGAAIDTSTAPVVTSLCHNNVWRTTGENSFIIGLVYTDLHVDSQRRRLTGRGT